MEDHIPDALPPTIRDTFRDVVASDTYAATFQSLGAYRSALLKHLDNRDAARHTTNTPLSEPQMDAKINIKACDMPTGSAVTSVAHHYHDGQKAFGDISIDIETLSTRFDAAILSIGAVAFDRKTGEIGERLYLEVEMADAMAHGHISASTLQWWMQQNEKARELFCAEGKSTLASALCQLSNFVANHLGAKVWGNGATFDITILEQAYTRMSIPIPWKFWDVRDMRTIVEAVTEIGFDKRDVLFEGTKHNAMDDAAHQARVIAHSWIFLGMMTKLMDRSPSARHEDVGMLDKADAEWSAAVTTAQMVYSDVPDALQAIDYLVALRAFAKDSGKPIPALPRPRTAEAEDAGSAR